MFYLFIIYILYKCGCTLPEDDPQRVETYRSFSGLIVNILYCNVVHLLVFSCIVQELSFLNMCVMWDTMEMFNCINFVKTVTKPDVMMVKHRIGTSFIYCLRCNF